MALPDAIGDRWYNAFAEDGGEVALRTTTGGGGGTSDVNLTEVDGSPITLGQAAMADSLPVVIASDQSPVDIAGLVAVTNFPATQAVTGPLTDAELRATPVPVSGTVSVAEPVTVDGTVAATQSGAWNIGTVTTVTGVTNTVSTKEVRSATPSQSSVADNAASVTILAANANRLGATIANDSSAALYLKLGATASTTSYTVRMVQYAYYEVPFGYTGVIDGIWASDPGDGAARITELTA